MRYRFAVDEVEEQPTQQRFLAAMTGQIEGLAREDEMFDVGVHRAVCGRVDVHDGGDGF